MLFLINVIIAVATFWNAAEDHGKALSDYRSAHDTEKAKVFRKLFLLWLVPVLSIAAIPLTWREQTESERRIAEAHERAGKANQQAAESNERSKQLESTNLKLRANLLELELKVSSRTITETQRDNFVKYTKDTPKILLFICVGRQVDDETENFVRQIQEMLASAGFGHQRQPEPMKKPQLHIVRPLGTSTNFSVWIVDGNTANTTDAAFTDFSQPEIYENQAGYTSVYAEVGAAFQKIGIATAWMKTTNNQFKGDILIYVPPKQY